MRVLIQFFLFDCGAHKPSSILPRRSVWWCPSHPAASPTCRRACCCPPVDALGKQVFVENKPGAGGTIGADAVAKSAPDGYTLLATATPHVISAHLYRTLPYDSLKTSRRSRCLPPAPMRWW
jgi:hypothetical protein